MLKSGLLNFTGATKAAGLLLAVCVVSVGGNGCGYTTRSSLISSKYRTICIAPFVNKIDITQEVDTGNKYKVNRPMVESEVTRMVINKYLFDGNLKPVSAENADLLLKGEVVEFRRDPLRYDENENAQEYRVSLRVNLKLVDRRDNDTALWEENGFTGTADYFVSGAGAKSESAAVTESIQDLARRIVERTVEDW
jgi:hypothetical protein